MLQGSLELNWLGVSFEASRIESIISVPKLYNSPGGVTDGEIVLCGEVLQSFHQTSLHIPSLGRLDRGIHQTLASRDGVE